MPLCASFFSRMAALLFRQFKTVSRAAHSFQIPGTFGIVLNFFPQLSYIHIHRAWTDERSLSPNRVQYLVASEDAAGVLRQVMQQTKLSSRGGDRIASDAQGHSVSVNFQLARADDHGHQGRLTAPQYGFKARYQLPRTERLGNVIVRAHLQPQNAVGLRGLRRQKNNRSAGQGRAGLPYAATKIKPVTAWNHDVQEH